MRADLARDAGIAAIAERQYGVVTYEQLRLLGLDRGAVARRAATGRLHRLHRAVYAVGHAAPRDETRWIAAVLACGDGAVLSHRSAAALWLMLDADDSVPHVTVPGRGARAQPAIVVHRARLEPADRVVHRGIPVTSPERTLHDFARGAGERELTRAVREAQFRRLLDASAPKRRTPQVLRALLEDDAPTQSSLEDAFLRLCARHDVPRPLTQQPLLGRRVDFLWPAERVVVEVDGWEGHGGRAAFQADRTGTNLLQLAGYTVLRFAWADVTRRPAETARQLRSALASP